MKKAPLKIMEQYREEQSDNCCNKWTKGYFTIEIGKGDNTYTDEWGMLTEINGHSYDDKYIAASIMLGLIDNYAYGFEFDFTSPSGVAEFMHCFGYCSDKKACEVGLKAADSLHKLHQALKEYWGEIDDYELSRLREIHSDGAPELVMSVWDELVSKYFEFDFERDFVQ